MLFNLKNELENTVISCAEFNNGVFVYTSKIENWFDLSSIMNLGSVTLPDETLIAIQMLYMRYLTLKAESTFLQQALTEGIFLTFHFNSNGFQSTNTHLAAIQLNNEIRKFNDEAWRKTIQNEHYRLLASNRENNTVEVVSLQAMEALHVNIDNIFVLSKYLRNRVIDGDFEHSHPELNFGIGSSYQISKNKLISNEILDQLCKE